MKEGSLIVNSSQGGGSKDTWVLADDAAEPVEPVPERLGAGMRERTSVWPIESNWQDRQAEAQQQ